MQHGIHPRFPAKTARPRGRRMLCLSLNPLSGVASHVFQTISQYLVTTTTLFFSTTSSAPYVRQTVPAQIGEQLRVLPGSRVSRRGRIVS